MEIPITDINNKTVGSGSQTTVNSRGRTASPSGTEGQIDITDGTTRIAVIYWDCPWGGQNNAVEVRSVDPKYDITLGPWNRYQGSIGNVVVDVKRLN